jgi:hypothetical protein
MRKLYFAWSAGLCREAVFAVHEGYWHPVHGIPAFPAKPLPRHMIYDPFHAAIV